MAIKRHPIKDALYAWLTAKTRLLALLGSVKGITSQWPDVDARYTPSDLGTDFETQAPVFPPRARVTFVLLAPSKDIKLPIRDDLFQVDVWSPNPELREEVVQEIEALDGGTLNTGANGRVTEVRVQRGPDLYETDTKIHHTPLDVRVLWTP